MHTHRQNDSYDAYYAICSLTLKTIKGLMIFQYIFEYYYAYTRHSDKAE